MSEQITIAVNVPIWGLLLLAALLLTCAVLEGISIYLRCKIARLMKKEHS